MTVFFLNRRTIILSLQILICIFFISNVAHSEVYKSLSINALSDPITPPTHLDRIFFFDIFERPTLDKAQLKILKKSLKEAEKTTKDELGKSQQAEVYTTLADLSFKYYLHLLGKRYERYIFKKKDWIFAGRSGQPPRFLVGREEEYLQKAINAYRYVTLDLGKNYATEDVVFNLAKLLSLTDPVNSQIYVQRFAKAYPNSDKTNQGKLIAAGNYFAQGKFKRAKKLYRRLMLESEGNHKIFARYMLGWTHLKIADTESVASIEVHKKGLAYLVNSAFAAKLVVKKKARHEFLVGRIMQDLVVLYSDLDLETIAEDGFKKLNEGDSYSMVLYRGGVKAEGAGKLGEAVQYYQEATSYSETFLESPYVHRRLLQIHQSTQNWNAIVEVVANVGTRYFKGSKWADEHSSDTRLLDRVQKVIGLDTLKAISRLYKMKEMQGEKVAIPIQATESFFQNYHNLKSKNLLRYDYARYLMANGYVEEASRNFYEVAQNSKDNKKRSRNSYLLAVTILHNKLGKNMVGNQIAHPVKERPLEEIESLFTTYLQDYKLFVPGAEPSSKIQLTLAGVYYDSGRYDLAKDIYKRIVEKDPGSTEAQASNDRLLEYYENMGEYEKALSFVQTMLKSDSSLSRQTKSRAEELFQQATFYTGAKLYEAKNIEEAKNVYLAFQETNPKSPYAADALFNAIQLEKDERNSEKFITLSNRFLVNYPSSIHHKTVLFELGHRTRKLAQFEQSAKFFLLFQKKYPLDELAAESLFMAAENFHLSRREDIAAGLFLRQWKFYPNAQFVGKALFRAAKIYQDLGDKASTIQLYQTLFDGGYTISAQDRVSSEVASKRLKGGFVDCKSSCKSIIERIGGMNESSFIKSQLMEPVVAGAAEHLLLQRRKLSAQLEKGRNTKAIRLLVAELTATKNLADFVGKSGVADAAIHLYLLYLKELRYWSYSIQELVNSGSENKVDLKDLAYSLTEIMNKHLEKLITFLSKKDEMSRLRREVFKFLNEVDSAKYPFVEFETFKPAYVTLNY